MKKALKKLIPTIIMVLIAASMVGTSTFAWFSMNSKVTVTGMTVTTSVDDYLSIAESNVNGVIDAQYQNDLEQTKSAKLRPSSTVDGLTYYYTNPTNVQGNGDAKTDVYALYSEAATGDPATNEAFDASTSKKSYYDAAFNTAYGITSPAIDTVVYGYLDYEFYIKATNSDTANAKYLCLTECKLLYNGSILQEHAWRIAVYAHQAERNTAYTTPWNSSTDKKAILTPVDATNFTAGQAVNSTGGTGSVTYTSSSAWSIDEIAAGATEYNKITVRLWLEGEDTTCNNETFATLTSNYTLALAFELKASPASVSNINFAPATTTSGLTGTVTVDGSGNLANGETPTAYAWKNADGTAADGTNNAASYTATEDGDYYCVVTTAEGTYRTAIVHLAA